MGHPGQDLSHDSIWKLTPAGPDLSRYLPDVAEASTPWLRRIGEAAPAAPWAAGVAVALGAGAFYGASRWLGLGFALEPEASDLRLLVIHLVVLAYLVGACLSLEDRSRRGFPALLAGYEGDPAALGEPGRYSATAQGAMFLVGGIVGILAPYVGPGTGSPYDVLQWSNAVLAHRMLAIALAGLSTVLVFRVLAESARWNTAARGYGALDLFDTRLAAPFTRQGLLHGWLLAGAVGAFALFLTEQGYSALLQGILIWVVPFAALGLYAPVHGIHRRIQRERDEALARCRRAWARHLAEEPAPAPGTLADLAATEARIEAIPVWPFDGPTLRRFALYLLIPIVSWSGGALVERLVDAWLG